VTTVTIVISFRVSVPVLSEQMAEAEPSVSTDDSRLTIAFFLAICWAPSARTTESTAGSPSGTAATASETPRSSTETRSALVSMSLVKRMAATTTAATATTANASARPIRCTSRRSGVGGSFVRPRRCATLPISVLMPVAVTTARPLPRVTAVALNTMFTRSPRATGPARRVTSLSTGSLSPVSAASSTVNAAASTSRPSAATLSPSASTRMSPGTMSPAGTRVTAPARTTAAVGAAIN
jgi:hypothetical protein